MCVSFAKRTLPDLVRLPEITQALDPSSIGAGSLSNRALSFEFTMLRLAIKESG